MRIAVKDIPSHPVEITGTVGQNCFNLQDHGIQCNAPIDVVAQTRRVTDVVLIQARVKARFSFECSRCLAFLEKDFEENFEFDYTLEPAMLSIELGEDIRQEIIMNFPLKVLCKEDCHGLCPTCGVNLNLEECQCCN